MLPFDVWASVRLVWKLLYVLNCSAALFKYLGLCVGRVLSWYFFTNKDNFRYSPSTMLLWIGWKKKNAETLLSFWSPNWKVDLKAG